MTGAPRSRLLLVGGGHSHLEVVRRFHLERPAGVALTLVSTDAYHHYSGMVPGYLRGTYGEEEIRFDLAALARAAGAEFHVDRAVGLDPEARVVSFASGVQRPYDIVSFGVGSTPAGSDRSEIRDNALTVKPMSRAVELRQQILALIHENAGSEIRRASIIGAGAAGVEVALAVAGALDAADVPREVHLLEAGPTILEGYSDSFRRRAETILAAKRLIVITGHAVTRVHPERVELDDDRQLPADLSVWLTGASAQSLFESSGLPTDERGFLLVNDSLRSVSDPRVHAAGDCATLIDYPETPKAGVYAVRQGPILWESLMATLEGREPPRYRPQTGFLSILNTGDGKSLLSYKGLVSYSRWAWWVKDGIDRRFMWKYRSLLDRKP